MANEKAIIPVNRSVRSFFMLGLDLLRDYFLSLLSNAWAIFTHPARHCQFIELPWVTSTAQHPGWNCAKHSQTVIHQDVWLAHQMEQGTQALGLPIRRSRGGILPDPGRDWHLPTPWGQPSSHLPRSTLRRRYQGGEKDHTYRASRAIQELAISRRIVGRDLVISQAGKCDFSFLRSL